MLAEGLVRAGQFDRGPGHCLGIALFLVIAQRLLPLLSSLAESALIEGALRIHGELGSIHRRCLRRAVNNEQQQPAERDGHRPGQRGKHCLHHRMLIFRQPESQFSAINLENKQLLLHGRRMNLMETIVTCAGERAPGATRKAVLITVAAALTCLGTNGGALAQEAAKPNNVTNAPAKMKFSRPATGAPSVRLTGGSRGTGDSTVTLDVLAPDDVGLTTQEQPSLFWYQSKPAAVKFELTLLQENKVKPLVQVTAERSLNAGIQRVRLSDHGVKLAPGVEYQWVVALIADPENRSKDLVASGMIKRTEASADLQKSIAAANPESLAGVYAEAGIWYDALSTISDRIDADPQNKSLQESRADLLRQGGLKGAVVSPLAAK